MAMKMFDAVRLDHFIGFYRHWAVPAGSKNAVSGKWIEGPREHFFETVLKALNGVEFIEFDFRDKDPDKKPNIRACTEILPKGSLVVFPSFVWHRVKPVTKGVRHSLVIWNLGWPFR